MSAVFNSLIVVLNVINVSVPRVEFPEAAVQVFQGSNEEPPAVDTHRVVVEVGVQDKHWIKLLTVPQSSHESWVVVQPESFAEPVDTRMSHVHEPVKTSVKAIF